MKRIKNFKALLTVLAIALVLTVAVGGTIAWLAASTDPVVNTFTPGEVPPSIVEDTEGNAKNSIKVTNTGNVDAYIRVAIVANWCDESGNVLGAYTGTISITDTWFKQGDYYYHKAPVSGKASTSELLESAITWSSDDLAEIQKTYPNAAKLEMVVITQSIQADGTTADGTPVVTAEWGVEVDSETKYLKPTTTT